MTIDDLKNYDFFILRLREHKSIAINIINNNGDEGIMFYKTNLGWSLNPTKIGKGFLSNCREDFDYTNNFNVALDVADQTR